METVSVPGSEEPGIEPHSLGQSVEWKRNVEFESGMILACPTRWGNQLNGNYCLAFAMLRHDRRVAPLAGAIS